MTCVLNQVAADSLFRNPMSLPMAQTGIVCWLLAGVARCSGFFLTPLTEHRWGRHRNGELLATLRVERGEDKTFGIDYNWINRPASALPPLVVLHGGPSVPSNYLRPLEDVVTDRSILFYDQLGCGKSDEPKETSFYSIPLAVNDLIQLLQEVGVSEQGFHLYGQSFGGILAFEYLKRRVSSSRGLFDAKRFPLTTLSERTRRRRIACRWCYQAPRRM